MPLLDRWTVVVSGAEKINDIRKASLEELSSISQSEDVSAVCRARIIWLMTNRWTILLVAPSGWTLTISKWYEVP